MNELIGRVLDFKKHIFPIRSDLYARLAADGQSPKALIISCADSRVVPEEILRAEPGDLFVCRNAGNVVPPFSQANGGVTSTVEYAVEALGVRDIIICGHSGCGAMQALMNPKLVANMPNVAAWLRHCTAARQVVESSYPELPETERLRTASLENVVVQLTHIRTHPSVAAGLARGELALHGWYFDIAAGEILALDGESGSFRAIHHGQAIPVAQRAKARRAVQMDPVALEAAE
jgi:carbonic anhydrase